MKGSIELEVIEVSKFLIGIKYSYTYTQSQMKELFPKKDSKLFFLPIYRK